LSDLERQLVAWNYNPVHAGRLLRFHYSGMEGTIKLRGVPAGLVERLRNDLAPRGVSTAARQVAEDGTTKLLLRPADARTVETVLMPDFRDDRAAGCVSTQVGCAMGCDFCATT
jgi:23S rRNA (adenine2503-C2)-methyltransferase